MIILLALVALIHPAPDTTGSAPLPDPTRQVITRADIEAAAPFRIDGVLRLIEGARDATVDGFAWTVSLVDGEPFGGEEWMLFLDGERIWLGVLGQQNLSVVPVAVTYIDSVEVWATPRMAGGTLAPAGSIHVYTSQRRQPGVSVRAGASTGLQNGDPGPFRYVPEIATPNVDKFGSDYEGWVSGAGERWRTTARFVRNRYYPTDPASFNRNLEMIDEFPRATLLAGAWRAEFDGWGGTHGVQLAAAEHLDLWFFAPYGRELSARRTFGQLGVQGTIGGEPSGTGRRPSVTYRISAAQNHLQRHLEESLGPDPAWRARVLSGGLEARAYSGGIDMLAAGSFERHDVEGAVGYALGRFSAAASRGRAAGQERLEVTLAAAEGEIAAGLALTSTHVAGATAVVVRASVMQRLPAELGRLAFWSGRGYDAFGSSIVVEAEPPGVATTAQLRVDATRRFSEGVGGSAGLGVRVHSGMYVEHAPRSPDPDDFDAARITVGEGGLSGAVLFGRSSLDAHSGIWRGRLWADAQVPSGGNATFERVWRRVPRLRAGARGVVRPAAGFSASAALSFRTSAYWPEFEYLTGANDGLYDAAIPSMWLLDASLEKWFWQGRLRASLAYRNLLAQEERYHPVGATFNRRFYLRVEVNLGGTG